MAQAEINFISVDCVVADMISLARSGFGDHCIYHLTSTASTAVAKCWTALSNMTGLNTIDLVAPGTSQPQPIEMLIVRRVGFFMNYINIDRRFTRSLTPAWRTDKRDIEAYVRNAVDLITKAKRKTPKLRPAEGV